MLVARRDRRALARTRTTPSQQAVDSRSTPRGSGRPGSTRWALTCRNGEPILRPVGNPVPVRKLRSVLHASHGPGRWASRCSASGRSRSRSTLRGAARSAGRPPRRDRSGVTLPGAFPAGASRSRVLRPARPRRTRGASRARRGGGRALRSLELFDVYDGPGTPQGMKSLAFALQFQHPERTLTEAEVQDIQARMVRPSRRTAAVD